MADDKFDSRLRRMLGDAGLTRLREARVCVVGLGGVGSNCVEALARGGIGTLYLVDRDVVAPSNINRQAIAFHSTIGQRKVDACAEMIHDINPDAHVEIFHEFITAETLPELACALEGRVDIIVDAIDTVTSKIALAQWALRADIPIVASMGGGNKLHPEYLSFSDLYSTSHDPLCRSFRKLARKAGIPALRVLYSSETPAKTQHEAGADWRERTNLGTMSYMPPIMGQMIAGDVILHVLGMAEQ